MSKIKYTVIIPTHNRPQLLERCLRSIVGNDHQGIVEIVVVSDTKNSETIGVVGGLLRESDQFVIRSGRPGPAPSRNLGMSISNGEYIAFLDDDDEWAEGYIDSLESMGILKSANFIFGNCEVITESRSVGGPIEQARAHHGNRDKLNKLVFSKNQVHMSCFLFHRIILEHLEFDAHMKAYEDWDFLLSVFEANVPVHVELLVSKVYEVIDSTTDRRGDSNDAKGYNVLFDYLYVYRKHPTKDPVIAAKRQELIAKVGLKLPVEAFISQ